MNQTIRQLATLLMTSAVLSFGLTAASAADLPTKARPYAAPPTAYDWSGFYIGGNVGWASGTTSISDPAFDWFGSTFDRRKDSFTGGGQIGWNYQRGRAVFGIEADMNWLNLGKTELYDTAVGRDPSVVINWKWSWLATVRGRAGVAVDDILVYLTAGAAFARPRFSWTELDDPPDSWPEFGGVRVGWTVGGGIEYGVGSNWSVKLEGLYVDLGKEESTNLNGFPLEVRTTAFIGRVGLNYRFGSARY
jgi:outer membrane immunogenic protein